MNWHFASKPQCIVTLVLSIKQVLKKGIVNDSKNSMQNVFNHRHVLKDKSMRKQEFKNVFLT